MWSASIANWLSRCLVLVVFFCATFVYAVHCIGERDKLAIAEVI